MSWTTSTRAPRSSLLRSRPSPAAPAASQRCAAAGRARHSGAHGVSGGTTIRAEAYTPARLTARCGLQRRPSCAPPELRPRRAAPQVRGWGLILGVELKPECGFTAAQLTAANMRNGLLTVPAGEFVLRLVPPLVVSAAECDKAVAILEASIAEISKSA